MKKLRILLFPFSVIYGIGVRLRNYLYDKKILRSASFDLPLINVGNLSVGGTGKTPMVEYLIELLTPGKVVATLSRGYRRKSKGFLLANELTTSTEIGDEPMQIHLKYPHVAVAVAEERIFGIPQILQERPETDVIIMDDAFQHRVVTAGINILLTSFDCLYTKDFLLPAGNLRDTRNSSTRADIIVVTKCKPDLSIKERKSIITELRPLTSQSVFFAGFKYGVLYHWLSRENYTLTRSTQILLWCAIANPRPLETELQKYVDSLDTLYFKDHHSFNIDDLRKVRSQFDRMDAKEKIIITTEKDAVRLTKFKTEISNLPLYVLPVKHYFLFGEGASFDQRIKDFVKSYQKS